MNQLFFISVSIVCLLIDKLFETYTFYILFILIFNLFIIHTIPSLFKLLKITNEI